MKKFLTACVIALCVSGISFAVDYASMDMSDIVSAMSSMSPDSIAADMIAVANSNDTITAARMVGAVNQHMASMATRADREALAGNIVGNTSNIVPGVWSETETTIVYLNAKNHPSHGANGMGNANGDGFDNLSHADLNIFEKTKDLDVPNVSSGPNLK